MKPIPPEIIAYIIDQACAIQQIPAPTFVEQERASYLQEQFARLGVKEISQDAAGNVLACLPGGSARPLVISAHLDTVHPADRPLTLQRTPERITGPGIGDNSLAVAALLGLARHVLESSIPLPGDLWLVGDVAEEGLGNLKGMTALVNRFEEKPAAYLILEGLGLGMIYHRGLGVSRYRIRVDTAGGHSWGDYGIPSAIHELAHLITRLTGMTLPTEPRTTLNVGIIHGGISVNTIASHAWMDLDLRSEDYRTLQRLVGRVQQRVQESAGPGVSITMEAIGERPAGEIPGSHPLVQAARACLQKRRIQAMLEVGSTDANIPLSRGYPAVCVGLTRGGNAHTTEEFILTEPLAAGMDQVLCLIESAWMRGGSVR